MNDMYPALHLASTGVTRQRSLLLVTGDMRRRAEVQAALATTETVAPFEVKLAASLPTASRALATLDSDIIVLDLGLEGCSPGDLLEWIRWAARRAPVVGLLDRDDASLQGQAARAGMGEVFGPNDWNHRLFGRAALHIAEQHQAPDRPLRAVLDATPDAIVVANRQGVVRYVNHGAIELFRRNEGELLGEQLGFSVRERETAEIVITRPGGSRLCELRVVEVEWGDEPTVLAMIRDITDQREADDLRERSQAMAAESLRVEEASRMKSAFVASMSHELRTPLNAIIGFTQLLVDRQVDCGSPKYFEFLGHMSSAGAHLLHLVDDVLDLAKVEAGKMVFEPAPMSPRQAVTEVVSTLAPITAGKHIDIDLALDDDIEQVVLDPRRFKQVLFNYLSNALKFTAPGGRVQVRTGAAGAQAFRIEVEDSGVGIAPADLGRLFTDFEQLESRSRRPRQGTGLGLALTRRMVEAQGGTVAVVSRLGAGSTFSAILPRNAALAERM